MCWGAPYRLASGRPPAAWAGRSGGVRQKAGEAGGSPVGQSPMKQEVGTAVSGSPAAPRFQLQEKQCASSFWNYALHAGVTFHLTVNISQRQVTERLVYTNTGRPAPRLICAHRRRREPPFFGFLET